MQVSSKVRILIVSLTYLLKQEHSLDKLQGFGKLQGLSIISIQNIIVLSK